MPRGTARCQQELQFQVVVSSSDAYEQLDCPPRRVYILQSRRIWLHAQGANVLYTQSRAEATHRPCTNPFSAVPHGIIWTLPTAYLDVPCMNPRSPRALHPSCCSCLYHTAAHHQTYLSTHIADAPCIMQPSPKGCSWQAPLIRSVLVRGQQHT